MRTAAQQALDYMKSVGQMDMHPEEWVIVGRLEAALAEPVQGASSVRELLTQAAAMGVAAERAGRYEGASWVADAVLETASPQRPAEPTV